MSNATKMRDSSSDVEPVIMLNSGILMHTAHPASAHIYTKDIAQGLSLTCRWGGQIDYFYSVAQHSVLLYDVMRRDFPDEHEWALWALLHDASEAYIGDVPRPFKQYMNDFLYKERQLLAAVAERFCLAPEIPHEVLRADHHIGLDEFVALHPGKSAGFMRNLGFEGIGIVVDPWSWQDAHKAWLSAMKHALGRCNRMHIWQEDCE